MINSPLVPMEMKIRMKENSGESRTRKRALSESEAANTLPLTKRLSRGASCVSTSTDEDSTPTNPANEDDERRTQVRKKILAGIEARLDNDSSSRKALAQLLEKNLYNNAYHFEQYADVSTLDARIRLGALACLSRCRLKKIQKSSRRQTLYRTLGEAKYQEVCDLVKTIQDLRAQVAESLRCTTSCETRLVIPGQRAMPTAVRNFFFNTQLIVATENTPLDQIELEKWDTMIEQARGNIEAFQEWSGLETKCFSTGEAE